MAGRWHAFVPTHEDRRDVPVVVELAVPAPHGSRTRAAAIAALERSLKSQHDRLSADVACVGRALAHCRELRTTTAAPPST